MKIMTVDNKGIHLIASDGTCFSLQFGYGNYCENRDKSELLDLKTYQRLNALSQNCEVAVIQKGGNWITHEHYNIEPDEMVCGYVNIQEAIFKALKYEHSLLGEDLLVIKKNI